MSQNSAQFPFVAGTMTQLVQVFFESEQCLRHAIDLIIVFAIREGSDFGQKGFFTWCRCWQPDLPPVRSLETEWTSAHL